MLPLYIDLYLLKLYITISKYLELVLDTSLNFMDLVLFVQILMLKIKLYFILMTIYKNVFRSLH